MVLSMSPLPADRIPKTIYYCKMMMSQLNFMQTFVDDLLDLRAMRDGIFSLTKEVFDAQKTFELVLDVFGAQAVAKKVNIVLSLDSNLRLPQEMKYYYGNTSTESPTAQ